ncbi:MAG: hypothetical protein Q8O89_03340 [Nanoarchaeota archaeon]|nr:hypothetical protein [Nanoarchaeota archaeon]
MNDKKKELNFWRILSNFWGIVAAIIFSLTFFAISDLNHLLTDITIIYLSILSIYTGLKEYNRWKSAKFMSRYHGEIFVILWTILIMVFILLSAFDKNNYKLATEFTATYLSVLGIFAISRKSKNLKS